MLLGPRCRASAATHGWICMDTWQRMVAPQQSGWLCSAMKAFCVYLFVGEVQMGEMSAVLSPVHCRYLCGRSGGEI
eukprot:7391507-Prymnesium_polylepis.2